MLRDPKRQAGGRQSVGLMEGADELVTVKALSVWQPWASLIADWRDVEDALERDRVLRQACEDIGMRFGPKRIETRYWTTGYRGPLIICASKKPKVAGLPTGVALYCRPMTAEDEEAACCRWSKGLYAWVLDGVKPFAQPFDVRGQQGLFDIKVERKKLAVLEESQ